MFRSIFFILSIFLCLPNAAFASKQTSSLSKTVSKSSTISTETTSSTTSPFKTAVSRTATNDLRSSSVAKSDLTSVAIDNIQIASPITNCQYTWKVWIRNNGSRTLSNLVVNAYVGTPWAGASGKPVPTLAPNQRVMLESKFTRNPGTSKLKIDVTKNNIKLVSKTKMMSKASLPRGEITKMSVQADKWTVTLNNKGKTSLCDTKIQCSKAKSSDSSPSYIGSGGAMVEGIGVGQVKHRSAGMNAASTFSQGFDMYKFQFIHVPTNKILDEKIKDLSMQAPAARKALQATAKGSNLLGTSQIIVSQDITRIKKAKNTTKVIPKTQNKQTDAQNPFKKTPIDKDQLNNALFVSKKYESVLNDNSIFIDERGYHQTTFDIIKKKNGDFALVYGASTENLDLYSKGILFTLSPNLNQKGSALIITKNDEELRDIRLSEFYDGNLSIAYTCNDNSCVKSNGQRNNKFSVLKYVNVRTNGQVKARNIDDTAGKIQIKGMFSSSLSSNITVAYNFNGMGKLGHANIEMGSFNMTCNLKKLPSIESTFDGASAPLRRLAIKSISLLNDSFLILHDKQLKTPVWQLKNEGLSSGIKNELTWPLLIVNSYEVTNGHGNSPCNCNNDPYTIYTDKALKLNNIINAIPLSDGSLGILEKVGTTTYLNVFNSELKRLYPHVELAKDIHQPSIQSLDLGNNKILFFYKTKFGTNKMQYRATIYDWKTNKTLLSGSNILWQNIENFDWDIIHKLVRVDDNRLVAVSFKEEDGFYKNTQTIEFRVLTLNLK